MMATTTPLSKVATAAASYSRKDVSVGIGGGDFVVHTKHTCNKCFQRPIIGQRYTSDAESDFHLCSRCYEANTMPEIKFTETATGKLRPVLSSCSPLHRQVCRVLMPPCSSHMLQTMIRRRAVSLCLSSELTMVVTVSLSPFRRAVGHEML